MKHCTAAICAFLIVLALAAMAVVLHLTPSEFVFFELPRDAAAFNAHQANARMARVIGVAGFVLLGCGCFLAVRHAIKLHRGR